MFARNVRLVATAAMLLLAAGAGCQHRTYRILTDLPEPPGLGIALPAASCPASGPASALEPMPGAAASAPACDSNEALWAPECRQIAWRYIVIHHSATDTGAAASFDRLHRQVRHWDELGYHFVIGNGSESPDGTIEIGSRWYKQKWGAHCGGTPENEYNEYGIGICLVGDFRQHLPTPKQLAALSRLTRYLAKRYQIPPERIIGHGQAPGATTQCPGEQLQAYIATTLRKEIAHDQSQ